MGSKHEQKMELIKARALHNVTTTTDKEALVQIARSTMFSEVAITAINKISDEESLILIAKNTSFDDVKQLILEKISKGGLQFLLKNIALSNEQRRKAIDLLSLPATEACKQYEMHNWVCIGNDNPPTWQQKDYGITYYYRCSICGAEKSEHKQSCPD